MARSSIRALKRLTDELVAEVKTLRFRAPVTHVYNPLVYARAGYDRYLESYAAGRKEVVLLGMNPGPWGMAQTGVPFGDPTIVREWLEIEAPVARPEREHPARPILGFESPRREVSGSRLWGWAHDTFGTPQRFFRRFFVANYCPLVFLEQTGRNRTPDKLAPNERERLVKVCDRALRALVEALAPRIVLGVGRFARARAEAALADFELIIDHVAHPSPANPSANRGWARIMTEKLLALGIEIP